MSLRIYGRSEWGARQREGVKGRPLPVSALFLHHSATNPPPVTASLEQDIAHMRFIEQIGHNKFGYGISYPLVVMPSARIFEGLAPDREGAHTAGYNTIGSAICMAGNYDVNRPPQGMLRAVAELVAHGHSKGWWAKRRLTGGHRDVFATACPGKYAYEKIPAINTHAGVVDLGNIGEEEVEDVPTAEPGRLLKLTDPRMRGDDIKQLQLGLILQMRAHAGPIIQSGGADGVYGPGTEATVKAFQRHHGLDDDGVVGPVTRGHLEDHGIKFDTVAPTKPPAPAPTPAPKPEEREPEMAKRTRSDIIALEKELRARGYDIYCGPSHHFDGRCTPERHGHGIGSAHWDGEAIDAGLDPASGAAVSDYERAAMDDLAQELVDRDFRVIWNRGPGDHDDHAHIDLDYHHGNQVYPSGAEAAAGSGGSGVKIAPRKMYGSVGSEGRLIKIVQERIQHFVPQAIDGKFGHRTEAGVLAWQDALDVPEDGKVGPITVSADLLFQVRKQGHSLRRGDTGSQVMFIQYACHASIDGVFGPKTEAAVKATQRWAGVNDDGLVGPNTIRGIIV